MPVWGEVLRQEPGGADPRASEVTLAKIVNYLRFDTDQVSQRPTDLHDCRIGKGPAASRRRAATQISSAPPGLVDASSCRELTPFRSSREPGLIDANASVILQACRGS